MVVIKGEIVKSPGSEYYLMHKDIPVCLMEISDDGALSHVHRNVPEAEHFPLGGRMNDMKFHEWWNDRSIPKTRHGAKTALQRLGYTSTGSALVNNLALSLTDCYWIKPRREDLSWKDVSLFANDFMDTFGEITINRDHLIDLKKKTRFDCAASQGELQKKWCIDPSGRRYMVKGNYGASYQQSINEVFAARLHEQQGFSEHTPYYLTSIEVDGNRPGLGCLCYDYCNEHVESISAWELLKTVKLKQNESWYYPFREICLSLGMNEEYFDRFMDYEIMSDYLITNTDRHMNNIAVLRDPDSLKILGFAPIFDSGNSMFHDLPLEQLKTVRLDRIETHSFIKSERKLLQYVRDRERVDLDRASMDFSIYEQDVMERHVRILILESLYRQKMESLHAFQMGKDIWRPRSDGRG